MNTVFILSDRHNAEFMGCYGNAITRTPAIDGLAERGVRFERAYSLSPICSPARAAMITGQYVHETGVWDNVFAYSGLPQGWGHFFAEEGVRLASIGKLDYRPDAEHGIEETHLAVHREKLDIHSLFREVEILPRYDLLKKHQATGPADSLDAFEGDLQIAAAAEEWIEAGRPEDQSWILWVNFNDLHRPWNPPRDLWEAYDSRIRVEDLDERFFEEVSHLHPFHQAFIRHHNGELLEMDDVRRALVGYHAACEVLDRNVGRVLAALDRAGLRDDTLVVYGSDHGGACGEHRNWDHGAMYEESIRSPLIVAGPGVRVGEVEREPVSMLDVFPTLCEAAGLEVPGKFRGTSLLDLVRGESEDRPNFALCEYHGAGMPGSAFAVCSGPYKYVECVGERPMLFNLETDPHEMCDLMVERPDQVEVQNAVIRLRAMLYDLCCPEDVDVRVKADQRARKSEMAKSGQLFDEMWSRGYERREDRLVPRTEP
ncbi:MAG: sulfatase-like hydrolase/transferase [bacterium]|nr:sulfatase-like hydrolase/transferase [bacterium]